MTKNVAYKCHKIVIFADKKKRTRLEAVSFLFWLIPSPRYLPKSCYWIGPYAVMSEQTDGIGGAARAVGKVVGAGLAFLVERTTASAEEQ